MINLSDREKKLLKILLSLIGILFVFFFIISPIYDFKINMDNENESNILKLNKLDSLYEKYLRLDKKKKDYSNLLRSGVSVTSLIDTYAKEIRIFNNKAYTRDHPSNIQSKYKKITTDVKFESIDITSALKFIYKMENSNRIIKVIYLRMQQALKGKNTYDVTIKFDTYSLQ